MRLTLTIGDIKNSAFDVSAYVSNLEAPKIYIKSKKVASYAFEGKSSFEKIQSYYVKSLTKAKRDGAKTLSIMYTFNPRYLVDTDCQSETYWLSQFEAALKATLQSKLNSETFLHNNRLAEICILAKDEKTYNSLKEVVAQIIFETPIKLNVG